MVFPPQLEETRRAAGGRAADRRLEEIHREGWPSGSRDGASPESPAHLHASVTRTLRQAWDVADPKLAQRQLERLSGSLEAEHPGAAASILEGLEETLTLQRLGVQGALYRTLRTANPIENLNGWCRDLYPERETLADGHDSTLGQRRPARSPETLPPPHHRLLRSSQCAPYLRTNALQYKVGSPTRRAPKVH